MKIVPILLVCVVPFFSAAQRYSESVYTVSGEAIKGYDPVAYFTEDAAIEGLDEFTTEWEGSTWKFASQENLNLFLENPEDYAPQYGGYCAWGMAQGYKARVDPEKAWTIVNGKLYLNYNQNVQSDWLPEKYDLIKVADENWSNLED